MLAKGALAIKIKLRKLIWVKTLNAYLMLISMVKQNNILSNAHSNTSYKKTLCSTTIWFTAFIPGIIDAWLWQRYLQTFFSATTQMALNTGWNTLADRCMWDFDIIYKKIQEFQNSEFLNADLIK